MTGLSVIDISIILLLGTVYGVVKGVVLVVARAGIKKIYSH